MSHNSLHIKLSDTRFFVCTASVYCLAT